MPQLWILMAVLTALVVPTGLWLHRAMREGDSRWLAWVAGPWTDMGWGQYARALLAFHAVGIAGLFAILSISGFSWHLALNTAVSFVTNTNWQAYAGETLPWWAQMLGLAVQNFLSAAVGIAVAFALFRGFTRNGAEGIGNFWYDLLRATLLVLVPGSLVAALFFISQGVPQSLHSTLQAVGLEGVSQTIVLGPVASQEAIKMLGTNGGGFFNANSAHPFENPTPLTNFVQMLLIFLIPGGMCVALARAVKDWRQGATLYTAMALLFVGAAALTIHWEVAAGLWEGKETRFGLVDSALFAAVTTSASCGAVNAMHDSFSALGGMMPMLLMQLGEVVFGGVGSGMYGMILFALLAVFLAGLMVGRTPEYLGKKIGPFEMKMVAIAILVSPLLMLAGTSLAVLTEAGRAGLLNHGPHGLSEVLYAYSSAANNNGSAFAGLNANSLFYNVTLGLAMLLGRLGVIVPVLAIAGSLAKRHHASAGAGTLSTHGLLFVVFLCLTVIVVGALTFLPALALAPIAEHLSWGY
jgi:potassium-transporting ATPase potassium-binding subunit